MFYYTSKANEIDRRERFAREGNPPIQPIAPVYPTVYHYRDDYKGPRAQGSPCPAAPLTDAQKQAILAEVYAEQPEEPLTPEDLNRLAAIDEEKHTEGHKPRPLINPHD